MSRVPARARRRHGPDRDDQAEEGLDARDAAGGAASRLDASSTSASRTSRFATARRSGHGRRLTVRDDPEQLVRARRPWIGGLEQLDALLMRKDPPFDMEYIYTTYILELAENRGLLVVNKPASLRDINEKAYTSWFPQCTPPSLVTRSRDGAARVPRTSTARSC